MGVEDAVRVVPQVPERLEEMCERAIPVSRGAFRLGPVPPLADLLAAAGLGLRRGAVQRVALAA